MSRPSFHILMSAANQLSLNLLKRYIRAGFTAHGDLKLCLRSFFIPIDYTRTKEIPVLLDCSGILQRRGEKLRVLDIGSPQILSLSLGHFSKEWEIVYINPFEPELMSMRSSAEALGLENLAIVNADITSLQTLNGMGLFDFVLSCSVFEHIHPEDGGDEIAARNVSALLKEGGVFSLSVPCYREKFNEYVSGDVYAVKGGAGLNFFQRFYDENSLNTQIIKTSGLVVLCKKIIGERYYHENNIHKRMAFRIGYGRRALVLGRFFYFLSSIFMEVAEEICLLKKPYLAICSLRKS